MGKSRQRTIWLLIAVMAAVALWISPAVSEEGEAAWQCPETRKDETGLWEYGILEDGSAVITGFTIEGKTLKIPDEVDGIPVTAVAREPGVKIDSAKAKTVQSVVLPRNLTAVESHAFENFSGMRNIKLPAGITTIGTCAFKGCRELNSVNIPDGVRTIGESAFEDCFKLKIQKIPEGLKEIGRRAFAQSGVKDISLPEGLVSIGEEAFAFNTEVALKYYRTYVGRRTISNLRSVKFPASLETIGKGAFTGCDALGTVTFAKGAQLKEIGTEAFMMCFRFSKLVLPDTLQKIGASAFRKCEKLSTADLGGGITELQGEAFQDCLKLTTLIVPETLIEIGDDLFKNYSKKLKVTCPEGSAMKQYLKTHYPKITIVYLKVKQM